MFDSFKNVGNFKRARGGGLLPLLRIAKSSLKMADGRVVVSVHRKSEASHLQVKPLLSQESRQAEPGTLTALSAPSSQRFQAHRGNDRRTHRGAPLGKVMRLPYREIDLVYPKRPVRLPLILNGPHSTPLTSSARSIGLSHERLLAVF